MIYISLYHGRKSPDETMDDWGFNGPVFGPFDTMHWTYRDEIKFDFRGKEIVLVLCEDLVHYDLKFYGDFTVISEDDFKACDSTQKRLEIYDPEKAKL